MGHSRRVGHLVPRKVKGVPRRRITEDGPPDPGVGGEDQVPQRLDERPLAVDRLVQQLGWQAAGPRYGLVPQPLEDVPCLAEACRVCRAHLGPVRIPPVKLGVDQRPDVDTVDGQVHDFAVYVDVGQFRAAHQDAAHAHVAELAAGQVGGAELRAAEVDALEPGARQIRIEVIGHGPTVASPAGRSQPPTARPGFRVRFVTCTVRYVTEYRASFDAAVTFSNGGDLAVHGFRVDVPSPDIDEAGIAALFVASLGLLMTDAVELRNVEIFPERHKGTRGGPADRGPSVPD